jgi:integrase
MDPVTPAGVFVPSARARWEWIRDSRRDCSPVSGLSLRHCRLEPPYQSLASGFSICSRQALFAPSRVRDRPPWTSPLPTSPPGSVETRRRFEPGSSGACSQAPTDSGAASGEFQLPRSLLSKPISAPEDLLGQGLELTVEALLTWVRGGAHDSAPVLNEAQQMTPRRRKSRIYWRSRGGARRAYGDFRDLGGKREPLIPSGEHFATTDPDVAAHLASQRVRELEELRRRRALYGRSDEATLAIQARDYLIARRRAGNVTNAWLEACEGFLKRAREFFGADRSMESIRVSDVRTWAGHLLSLTGSSGRKLGPETVRRHRFTLSAVYRFTQETELLPPGFNPVASFREKPPARQAEAHWLEVPDAALLLEAARTLPTVETPAGEGIGAELAYPLLATFLLTGARRSEVLGLELDDVSLDRRTVTFRPNAWRRLKTRTSWRVVAMCPQLEEVLRAYLFDARLERPGKLLFPSFATGREAMLVDVRKLIDRIGARAGWKPGELGTRVFRHTWTAARLQTLDQGAPVSLYTVSRELGHGSEEMVKRVYAHLGTIRHRSEVVEFRVEQHLEALKDRLERHRGGCGY